MASEAYYNGLLSDIRIEATSSPVRVSVNTMGCVLVTVSISILLILSFGAGFWFDELPVRCHSKNTICWFYA